MKSSSTTLKRLLTLKGSLSIFFLLYIEDSNMNKALNNSDIGENEFPIDKTTPASLPATLINNKLLRDHFISLTKIFLSPLDYYFQLNQTSISINPYMDLSKILINFDENEFITRCESSNAILSPFNKINWKLLYNRFFHSPHFRPWFNRRRNEILDEIRLIMKHLRLDMTSEELFERVEIEHIDKIDLYLRIKEALAYEESILKSSPNENQQNLVDNIKTHLLFIQRLIPDFVKNLSNY